MSWRDDRYNAALLRGGWLLSALSIIVAGFVMLGMYEFKEGCETLRAIDGVNYNGALNTASINATTTAQTQKILDALAANKIEALQGKVSELQLAQAMQGVVRYPSSWAYSAGPSPFCPNGMGY